MSKPSYAWLWRKFRLRALGVRRPWNSPPDPIPGLIPARALTFANSEPLTFNNGSFLELSA